MRKNDIQRALGTPGPDEQMKNRLLANLQSADPPQAALWPRIIGIVVAACMLFAVIGVPMWALHGDQLFGGGTPETTVLAPGAGDEELTEDEKKEREQEIRQMIADALEVDVNSVSVEFVDAALQFMEQASLKLAEFRAILEEHMQGYESSGIVSIGWLTETGGDGRPYITGIMFQIIGIHDVVPTNALHFYYNGVSYFYNDFSNFYRFNLYQEPFALDGAEIVTTVIEMFFENALRKPGVYGFKLEYLGKETPLCEFTIGLGSETYINADIPGGDVIARYGISWDAHNSGGWVDHYNYTEAYFALWENDAQKLAGVIADPENAEQYTARYQELFNLVTVPINGTDGIREFPEGQTKRVWLCFYPALVNGEWKVALDIKLGPMEIP